MTGLAVQLHLCAPEVHNSPDCLHSGGSADPWPKDDWYGAEKNVDKWLGAVATQLSAQAKKA